jgi:hypothetical protein
MSSAVPACCTSPGTRPGTSWNGRSHAGNKGRRTIAHLGVDEKAVAKRHRYVTLVNDLDRGAVEYIGDDREKTSLDALLSLDFWTLAKTVVLKGTFGH